jgi:hypothetical protein
MRIRALPLWKDGVTLRINVTTVPTFALQMVEACVAYLDEQRCIPIVQDFQVKYTKEVEGDDGWRHGQKRLRKDLELGLRVRFQRRDDVDAICVIFWAGGSDESRMWRGECNLTTLGSTGLTTLKFSVEENMHGLGMHAPGLVVRPYEGPLFPKNIVGSPRPDGLRSVMKYHKWTIWRADSHDEGRGQVYGAWRKSWITGRPFFGTDIEVAELITAWEREYGEDKASS